MDQAEEIYKIVVEKIDKNGVSLLSDLHPGTATVAQRAKINGTQLVLSYNYIRNEGGFCRLNSLSVGYINNLTGKYKSVSGFYAEHQEVIIKKVLKCVPAPKMKTPELDLIRALSENKFIQK